MKTLWFSNTGGIAGAELALSEAARGLTAAGHAVHVVLPAWGALADRLQGNGIPVTMIPYRWWSAAGAERAPLWMARRMARNLLALPKIRRLLAQERPDLVVSNTLVIPTGAVAARSLGIPHLWYVHELFGAEGHGLYFDLGARPSLYLMNRLAARVLVSSHAVAAQLRHGIAPEKLQVVYQAVEVPDRFAPRRQTPDASRQWTPSSLLATGDWRLASAFRLVMVGRITREKRQLDAILAVARVAEQGLDVRLTLVGGEVPESGAVLRAAARELGLEERVTFVPFTPDPHSHVLEADAAVNCSRGEAFGRVTVEAMKLGRPVIGADSAGTSELIRDGENGLLYTLGDPEDLARKIALLYHDRPMARAMGQRASAWAHEQFSRARYTASLLDSFEAVLACHAPRAALKTVPNAARGTRHAAPERGDRG